MMSGNAIRSLEWVAFAISGVLHQKCMTGKYARPLLFILQLMAVSVR
jgi:hypothetical protein